MNVSEIMKGADEVEKSEFLGKGNGCGSGGEAWIPIAVPSPVTPPPTRTPVWRRPAAPAALVACLEALTSCGGPASADNRDWVGTIEFGGEGSEEAAMDLSLSLSQAEDGSVGGSGVLAVEEGGEMKGRALGEVSGRVSEDGELALTGPSGEVLSGDWRRSGRRTGTQIDGRGGKRGGRRPPNGCPGRHGATLWVGGRVRGVLVAEGG